MCLGAVFIWIAIGFLVYFLGNRFTQMLYWVSVLFYFGVQGGLLLLTGE